MTFQDETVALGTGSIMYRKSDDIRYLSDIAFYGEEENLLEEKGFGVYDSRTGCTECGSIFIRVGFRGGFWREKVFALKKRICPAYRI